MANERQRRMKGHANLFKALGSIPVSEGVVSFWIFDQFTKFYNAVGLEIAYEYVREKPAKVAKKATLKAKRVVTVRGKSTKVF